MFLYHPTFLVTALNLSIIVMLVAIGYFTSNPLVILGLLMLQQTPVIDSSAFLSAEEEDTDCEEEIDHESGNHRIGFLAKIKGEKEA